MKNYMAQKSQSNTSLAILTTLYKVSLNDWICKCFDSSKIMSSKVSDKKSTKKVHQNMGKS